MITDAQTRFSSAQAVTTGTQLSTNSYDMGVARDIGRGGDLRVKVSIDTTFTGGTSLQTNLVESVNSDLSSSSALYTGPVTVEASLTAGTVLMDIQLPKTTKRYVGLQFVTVGTHTAGAVTGGIVMDTDSGTYFTSNTGF